MKERENLRSKTDKRGINHHSLNVIGLVKLQHCVECDRLIEVSAQKLPDNNLASELVENNHNRGNFYD